MIGGSSLNSDLLLTTYHDPSICLDDTTRYVVTNFKPITIDIIKYDSVESIELTNLIYSAHGQRFIFQHGELVFKVELLRPDGQSDYQVADDLNSECMPTLINVKLVENTINPLFVITVMQRITGTVETLGEHHSMKFRTDLETTLLKLTILEIFTLTCSYLLKRDLYYVDTKPDNILFDYDDENNILKIIVGDLGAICCTSDSKLSGISYPLIDPILTSNDLQLYDINYYRKPQISDVFYGIYLLFLTFFYDINNYQQLYNCKKYRTLQYSYLSGLSIDEINDRYQTLDNLINTTDKTIIDILVSNKIETKYLDCIFDLFYLHQVGKNVPVLSLANDDIDELYYNILKLRLLVAQKIDRKLDVLSLYNKLTKEYQELTGYLNP